MFEITIIVGKIASLFGGIVYSSVYITHLFGIVNSMVHKREWKLKTSTTVIPAFFWTAFIALTYYV